MLNVPTCFSFKNADSGTSTLPTLFGFSFVLTLVVTPATTLFLSRRGVTRSELNLDLGYHCDIMLKQAPLQSGLRSLVDLSNQSALLGATKVASPALNFAVIALYSGNASMFS